MYWLLQSIYIYIYYLYRYFDKLGNSEWRQCKVEKYNEQTERFTVTWIDNMENILAPLNYPEREEKSIVKYVSRLNLLFNFENKDKFMFRRSEAERKRRIHDSVLRYYTQLQDEEITDSLNIKMPERYMKNIKHKYIYIYIY